jgi:alkylated DNA repair protein (DNA oxidative demethylase)
MTENGNLPDGFVLAPDFLTEAEEAELLQLISGLSFGSVKMRGAVARRRVAQFGLHYAFESFRLTPAPPLPAQFDSIRRRSAEFAGVSGEDFAETLVTEYPPGAGIGWHRDAPAFDIVAGISIAGPGRIRFQRGVGADRVTSAVILPRRSLYLLTGPARFQWQHTISPVRELRYSITFRTLSGPVHTAGQLLD